VAFFWLVALSVVGLRGKEFVWEEEHLAREYGMTDAVMTGVYIADRSAVSAQTLNCAEFVIDLSVCVVWLCIVLVQVNGL